MEVKIGGKDQQALARQMASLHEQIEDAMHNSPLKAEEKLAVLMHFNLAVMGASHGNYVEMELPDGSKISLKLEMAKPLAH